MVTVTAVKRVLPETALIDWTTALASISPGAVSEANLRIAMGGDQTFSDNSTMRSRMAFTDYGAGRGIGTAITLPESAQGVVFQPKLLTPFNEGYIEYDIRWRSGFPWGGDVDGGGKIPGLAGCDDTQTNPPAGQSPTPHGWSGRDMWVTDDSGGTPVNKVELVGYKYWPGQTPNTFGSNLHTLVELGDEFGTSDGTWRTIRNYYRMNTSFVTNTATDPASLVQGTHYLNDGLWQIYVDGTKQGDFTSQVLRFYEPAKVTHMQFSIFYGGPDAWAGAGGGVIDIARLRVVKIK